MAAAPAGATLTGMKVRDVMSTDVAVTAPGASLRDVLELLMERGVSGLPVVDEDDHVLGVVSQADILATTASRPVTSEIAGMLLAGATAKPDTIARTAGEAMSSPALVIDESCPVTQAAAQMLDHGIKRLPVVRAGTLVGIVTRSDLLRGFTRSDEEIAREIREDVLGRLLASRRWMSPPTSSVAWSHSAARSIPEAKPRSSKASSSGCRRSRRRGVDRLEDRRPPAGLDIALGSRA